MKHGNPGDSQSMANYMKNKFAFRGIKSAERKSITKPFLERSAIPSRNEVTVIVDELWDQPWREVHYFALELLQKYSKKPEIEWIGFYEKLITRNSWWDTVDGIAAWQVGDYFKLYPRQIPSVIDSWMNSQNIWLQRTCLIFQLRYGKTTDFELLTSCILRLAGSREFFIQKAIGWSLRQYYRVEPEIVFNFVRSHSLPNLSVREALKHHH
ncbi:MAG: DNA alkylation repair protein [Cyclobacteriaceae bacterium]|nr:DNA alkylation repair protein [Cyclobacteriaceae bacterium]